MTDQPPINKDDEWGAVFDSPFTHVVEDLARYYFFNYWCATGEFPPAMGVHERIMETAWYHGPSPRLVWIVKLCHKFSQEVH